MYYDTLNQERTARYMKRRGFTLAEVLITLGIIGVVAALTAPALVQNAGSAQTGPKLAKALSTWELANENLLNDQGANGLHAIVSSSREYGEELQNYMKISLYEEGFAKYGINGSEAQVRNFSGGADLPNTLYTACMMALQAGAKFLSKDGFMYIIFYGLGNRNANLPAHRQAIGIVGIDINGVAEPNRVGKDLFFFYEYNDGSLRPIGSGNWLDGDDASNSQYNWNDGTTDKCNETTVTSGLTCAGSIFENNLKVIYQ